MSTLLILLALQGAPDTLWTEAGEGWEFSVTFPGTIEEYPELQDILRDYAADQVEGFREHLGYRIDWDDPFQQCWIMDLNFVHDPSPRGMVCVTAWTWSYTGGAHGNTFTRAFLYSVAEKRLIGIVELLGGEEPFQSFAGAVVRYLQSEDFYDDEWVSRGAGPDPANYHTVIPVPGESCGLEGYQVIFPPYQVDCYATGIVEVFVPADWENSNWVQPL